MARQTQIDKTIDALREKRDAILAKASAEVQALEHAITTLQGQKVKRASRPRAVEKMKEVANA